MSNYKVNEIYILDGKYEVVLIENYGKYFGKIQSPLGGETWDVMLNRLTLKNYSSNETKL